MQITRISMVLCCFLLLTRGEERKTNAIKAPSVDNFQTHIDDAALGLHVGSLPLPAPIPDLSTTVRALGLGFSNVDFQANQQCENENEVSSIWNV